MSEICFLVLHVNDILLATNDKGLLYDVKQSLSKNFDMNDITNVRKMSLKGKKMQQLPYASIVGSLMHAQVCTRPDIVFDAGMLRRYHSNPSLVHCRVVKKVMRCLKGTKDYMLIYKLTNNLEVVGYSNSNFAGCVDSRK
ncbi:Retrovirus-related Pol polyprotein from transposon TNT 1-94 [Gossypium australe]|uniref:Retrovirus-related Pol polyprotein from transposon TNT 1-94 n=1 Tax=Gossypium australe TaxID=47621 RepID=A0A5B6VDM1_9ROSI|nr:Retrovirus-related Pol polyprotein from transposon TNT 1-94 [Gossypium australe]